MPAAPDHDGGSDRAEARSVRATSVTAVLAVGGAGAVAATGIGAGPSGLSAPGGAAPDDVASLAAGVLALLLLARWAAGAVLLLGSVAVAATGRRWPTGERGARRALPRGVHALLVSGLSAGVLGAGPVALAAGPAVDPPAAAAPAEEPLAGPPLAGPAAATGDAGDAGGGDGTSRAPGEAVGLDPGWTPTEPPAPSCPDAGPPVLGTPTRTVSDVPDVVVRRGDTLWSVAARGLPVDATDAEIAVEWPRWYRANRAVVGPDPDRLLPGVRLRAPLPLP